MERIYTEPSALHNISKAIPCKQNNTTPYTLKLNTKAKAFSGLYMQAATKPATLTEKWNSIFAMQKYLLPSKAMVIAVILLLALSSFSQIFGATYTSVASGNWNADATWSGTGTPIAGDIVTIANGHTITVTADAACASVTFSGAAATLTVNSTFALTISGNVTLNNAAGTNNACTITGSGTLSCASIVVGGTTTNLSADRTTIMTSTISNLSISGNLNINGEDDVNDDNNATFALQSGSVTVNGSVILDDENNDCDAILTLTTGTQTGTLSILGATPFIITTSPTFTPNGTSATVIYAGASQTIYATTYRNLIISGSGTKTLGGTTTTSGLLTVNSGVTLNMANTNLTIGSLTGSGDITNTTGTPGTRTFTIGSDNSSPAAFTGTINNGTANQVTVTKTGTGTLTLAGTGDNVGLAVTGSAGTVVLAKTSNSGVHAVGGGGLRTNGGTIQLGGSGGDQLYDGSNITLNGGTLNTGATTGFSEAITGTLTLSSTSTIALASGVHTLTIANSSGVAWAGTTLNITGWTGFPGSTGTSTQGKIIVGVGGLSSTQLAKVAFNGYVTGSVITATGELVPSGPTIYYSNGSNAPNLPSSWKSNRNGTGTSPSNFTSGNIFVVQNGHTMTTAAAWSVSGTNSKVLIENGGTLVASLAITLSGATYFQIDNGGTYKHQNTSTYGTTIFQGTEVFGNLSNVELNNSAATGPANVVFGNLTINLPISTSTVNCTGSFSVTNNLTVTKGNLVLQATDANYTIYNDLIVGINGTLTHSVNWDATGKLLRIDGNISIDGKFAYTVRSHVQMGGANKTIRTGPAPSSLSILTLVHTSGTITANGLVTVDDNFWASFNTTGGTFETSANTEVFAKAALLNCGGSVSINGGTLNVSGGLYVGYNGVNGSVTLSSGILNADHVNVGGASQTGTFTHSGGSANLSGNLTIFPSCSYICSNSPTISVAGYWANNGTFNAASSSVSMRGSDGQKIDGVNPTSFYNLEISNSSGSTVMGSNQTVNGELKLSNGALDIAIFTLNLNGTVSGSGTLTGGNGSTLTIGGSSGGNLGTINFTSGTGTLKTFTVNRTGTNPFVTLGSNLTVSAGSGGGTMTITSGVLTLQSGKWLTVDGTLANSTSANFIIESGSSVIQKSSGVNATVKRDIAAATWTQWNDGWHLLSSPVASQTINSAGGFITAGPPSDDYDFYAWSEHYNIWVNIDNSTVTPTWNSVNNNSNIFQVGKGYLVAYQQSGTKVFSGTLNHADKTVTGLTNNTLTTNHSWNLLGNPYPAALTWDASWSRPNVGGVCQIWSEVLRDYTSVPSGTNTSGTIPALNGFMVEVTTTPAQITIPASKQTHAVNTWYKSAASEGQLKLTVMAQDNSSGKETFIQVNPESTELFDLEYDGHYLRGYGPVFYSVAGSDTLSVNTLPALNESLVIPLNFQKNEITDFVITASGVENFETPVYLTDKKTGIIQNLGYNPAYSFSSAEGDNINRFTLSFKSPTSIKEETEEKFTVTVVNGLITLQSDQSLTGTVKVSDMLGRTVAMKNMVADSPLQINLNSTPGVYVVTVYTKSKTYSQKVVIR